MAYTCPTPGCEVKGQECDEPVHCSICLADLVTAATDDQRRIIASRATAAKMRPRPVDTYAEAHAEIIRLGGDPAMNMLARRRFRIRP